ncbi:MAG: NAD(P)-dependent oxidoreductase [Chloroflexota bacterium]|nr:NAD(P)-dependent oxidoreductase [Chloroflexota bacterium]
MKVLITGAGGNLGRVVAPALVLARPIPRLFDFRETPTEHEFAQGDVRNPEDIRRAINGVDAVVHAAALHGIHLQKWQPQDYWDINVTGTFNVYEAARQEGISRVVLCSTMGVYGESMEPPAGAWAYVSEQLPPLPTDVYGMSKLLCEEMSRYYARKWGITTVSLRLGMFVPEAFERYGFRLLFGGVDDRDVAQAVLLALDHQSEGGFDYFDIFAQVPFVEKDAPLLHTDLTSVLERYWPGCTDLIRDKGANLDELVWGHTIWSIEKARQVLGYRPEYNFGPFLEAWRTEDEEYYPFAGLAHWGV